MPRRAKVGTVRRSYSLPAELVEALEETADELDLNPGVLVRYAITGYLNNLELPPAGALNSDRLNAATAPIARRAERLRFCPVTKLNGSTCGLPIPCADHNAALAEEARRTPELEPCSCGPRPPGLASLAGRPCGYCGGRMTEADWPEADELERPRTRLDGLLEALDASVAAARELKPERPGVPLASGFEPEHGGETRPSRGGVDTGPGYRLPGHYGGTGA